MLFKLTSGKYGPGKTLYLGTFHTVSGMAKISI